MQVVFKDEDEQEDMAMDDGQILPQEVMDYVRVVVVASNEEKGGTYKKYFQLFLPFDENEELGASPSGMPKRGDLSSRRAKRIGLLCLRKDQQSLFEVVPI